MTNCQHNNETTKRLRRLVRLRELKAPRWIVRNEQAYLVLAAEGIKRTIAYYARRLELYERFVQPHMGQE